MDLRLLAVTAVLILVIPVAVLTMNSEGDEVSQADVQKIELKSNPTTGYDWYVVSAEGLNVSSDYVQDPCEPGMCGVGGTRIFTVSADAPGTYHFKAEYKRSFEKDSTIEMFEKDLTF